MEVASAKRIVAVIPFGARADGPRAGARARQLARRLVERFAGEAALEVRPVFLVAMNEAGGGESGAGHLVFGSVPDAATAAEYGAGIGATHALSGLLRDAGAERTLEVMLVGVAERRALATAELAIPPGKLADVEPQLARWLAGALAVAPATDLSAPPAANEEAYGALLDAMDDEVSATLLRSGDAERAAHAEAAAFGGYLRALRADPACAAAEERLLVLAAGALERSDLAAASGALEERTRDEPRAWRAHYLLGELRREAGDVAGAIVALSHADAIHPLEDRDQVRLASLERQAGATASALARLRRIAFGGEAYADAQQAIGEILTARGEVAKAQAAFTEVRRAGGAGGSWEAQALAALGRQQAGDLTGAAEGYRAALAAGAPAALRLDLARVLIARGDTNSALAELEAVLRLEQPGEVAALARRLRFGLTHPELARRLERAGGAALEEPEDGLDGAAADLAAALDAAPDLWEAHFGLGLIARRRGDAAASERAFRRALELWPAQPDAEHELGVTCMLAERTNEAVRHFEAALAGRPADPVFLADAGFAQLRAGNLPAARERLRRAREIDPHDAVTEAYVRELARVESLLPRAGP